MSNEYERMDAGVVKAESAGELVENGQPLDPQAVGELLRDCEHAMSRTRTSIVAQVGVDLDYYRLDLHRLTEAIKAVKAALPHFPPALPLTPEQEARAQEWLDRTLRRLDV